MSLQCILGSSGSGKSYYMNHLICKEAKKNMQDNFIVIVPEQFTMQTQKEFVQISPGNSIMNIDILSFVRLAYRVFEETPGIYREVLEDMGKSMILRKVLAKEKDKLKYFGDSVNRTGFINEIKSFLSELLQYNLSENDLDDMISSSVNPLMKIKLQDVKTIYESFRTYIKDQYITAEEVLVQLRDAVADSDFLKNCTICFDGFTGFTPCQYECIEEILKYAKKVYVTVTIDAEEDYDRPGEEFKLFHLSKKTIQKLMKICENAKVDFEIPCTAGKATEKIPYRFKESEALQALEHNLFRFPFDKYRKEQDDISIHVCKNVREEVKFAVREILRLVREEGYRYQDIAVVTGDISGFEPLLVPLLKKLKIPAFIDSKKSISSNIFVEMILAVIEVIRKDFDYESVFRFLRCGFSDVTKEEIDELENYVLAMGIRGFSVWSRKWDILYRKHPVVNMEMINEARQKVVDILDEVKTGCTGGKKSVREFTVSLYQFLQDIKAFEKLQEKRQVFSDIQEVLLEKEYRQIYGIVMQLFDHYVELLGDEKVTLKEYSELLEAGVSEGRVGFIPPGVDQVVIGDMERTRLDNVRAVFFLGVNDGIIPKVNGKTGILSQKERNFLEEHGYELAPNSREGIYTEQFYLYLNMTKPKNKLYLTYSKVGSDGKGIRPSYLISKVKKLFPELAETDEEMVQDLEHILSVDHGLQYFIEKLHDEKPPFQDGIWMELYNHLSKSENGKEKIKDLVQAAFEPMKQSGISKRAADLLYGYNIVGSVTRLEQFASCAFMHYCEYGLELAERNEYTIRMPDMGNIFHNAIELFSKRLEERKIKWRDVTEDEIETLGSGCIEEIALGYRNTIFSSSKRSAFMIQRMSRILKRTIWTLREHMRKGKFEEHGYELSFHSLHDLDAINIELDHGKQMKLKGRIDRIDTYEEEDSVYIKVIDYKSGNTTFDASSLYYGLQMQLVVYLGAAMEMETEIYQNKKIIPAGVFYYHIQDPIAEKRMSEEEVQAELLKKCRMDGYVNQEPSVVQMFDTDFIGADHELAGSVKSMIVPVETGKDGKWGKRSKVVEEKIFDSMLKYVQSKMKQFGEEMTEGTIDINPYIHDKKCACDYCLYKSVCGFDKYIPGYEYRKCKKLKEEEVWKELSFDGVDEGTTESN